MIEADRVALISTFEQAITDVKVFLKGNKRKKALIFMRIFNDLKKDSIDRVHKKWDRYFKTHTDFFFQLADVFDKEMKV